MPPAKLSTSASTANQPPSTIKPGRRLSRARRRLRRGRRDAASASRAEREREQATDPAALPAELAVEQPQRARPHRRAADAARMAVARAWAQTGGTAGPPSAVAPDVDSGSVITGAPGRRRICPGAPSSPSDAPEAVVGEREPELGVVQRAAHVGALPGGREVDEEQPGERDREHRGTREQHASDATRSAPGRARQSRPARSAAPPGRRRASWC